MDGEGIFYYNDGKKYVGSFKNDLKQGFGEFVWVGGISY